MMKTKNRFTGLAAAALTALGAACMLFASCGGNDDPPAPTPVTTPLAFAGNTAYDIPASTVGVAITSVNVAPGASGGKTPYTFSASGLPVGITISAAGVISGTPTAAAAAGNATITVKDSSAPAQSKNISIAYGSVTEEMIPTVSVTGVTLNKATLSLVEGTNETLTATIAPADATNQNVTWKSSNTATATVDASGKVTAVKAGSATITVTTADGGKTATCAVTVTTDEVPLTFTDNAAYDIPASTVSTAITDINVAPGASGGKTPYTFSATGLPVGITISTAGTISGTPTAATAAGTATITVKDSSTPQQSKDITIAFGAVTAPLTYSISASPTPLAFGSLATPYTQPAAKTVTVTNTGTGSVTLTQPTATNYTIGTLSKTVLAAGATATFTVRPKTDLAEGAYNEAITVNGTNGVTATVNVTFAVTKPTAGTTLPGDLTLEDL